MRAIFTGIEYAGKDDADRPARQLLRGARPVRALRRPLQPARPHPRRGVAEAAAGRVYEAQIFERRLPDVVLFHLTADDDTIRSACTALRTGTK